MRKYTKFIVLGDSILVYYSPKSVNTTPIIFSIFFSRYVYGNNEISLGEGKEKTKLEDTHYMISDLNVKLQS